MTKKELKVIRNCIGAAQDAIEMLGTKNYPHTTFEDKDIKDMFYELNDMCLKLTRKIECSK